MRTTPVERGPSRVTAALGVAAGVLALVAAGTYSVLGAGLAGAGLVVLLGGLGVGSRRAISIGATGLLAGVLTAGVAGTPASVLLVGVGATVFAWDAGGFAVDLGAQLGREADTRRVEFVHAAGSAAVAVAAAGVGYGVYLTAAGGQPVAALLFLLLAGVLLLATLDYA